MNHELIREVRKEDVPRVLEINHHYNFRNRTPEENWKWGFLYGMMSRKEVLEFVGNGKCKLFVHSLSLGAVNGYASVYSREKWLKRDDIFLTQAAFSNLGRQIIDSPFLYNRQIATAPELCERRVVFFQLDDFVKEYARERNVPFVVGEICTYPQFNLVSELLHKRNGWFKIGHSYHSNEGVECDVLARRVKE